MAIPFPAALKRALERDTCQDLSRRHGGDSHLASTTESHNPPPFLLNQPYPNPPQTRVGNLSHQDR